MKVYNLINNKNGIKKWKKIGANNNCKTIKIKKHFNYYTTINNNYDKDNKGKLDNNFHVKEIKSSLDSNNNNIKNINSKFYQINQNNIDFHCNKKRKNQRVIIL